MTTLDSQKSQTTHASLVAAGITTSTRPARSAQSLTPREIAALRQRRARLRVPASSTITSAGQSPLTPAPSSHLSTNPLTSAVVKARPWSGPIIYLADFPGLLCFGKLQHINMVVMLDQTAAYLSSQASTLYGRAGIVKYLIPYKTIAASSLAYWVWWGGRLPDEIPVISTSHYRTIVFDRRIISLNRNLESEDIHRLGDIKLTSPLRTACDIACLPRDAFNKYIGTENYCDFLRGYDISAKNCQSILLEKTRWPGHLNALSLFEEIICG